MAERPCTHPDIRSFDGMRCCLSCGEAVSEYEASALTAYIGTSNATAPYRYKKLEYTSGRKIRLVLLLPGNFEDALWCEIMHVDLDENPEYDAVSYTWATESGDKRLNKAILCIQSGSVAITTNCDAVLRRLRQLGKRQLWVDAICIDQTSVDERNHQVGLMDLIYKNARAVYSCIDHTANYSDLLRWLRHENSQDYGGTFAWVDLKHLFSLRYFTRVWVIQEVALARVAYLVLNDDVIPLTAAVIERMKKAHSGLPGVIGYLELPSVLRWSLGQRMKLGIVSCLLTSSSCDATDPRDHIYAVMGLMEDQAKSLIPVDYSLDLEVVYRNVVATTIAMRKDLGVLLFSRIHHHGYPSEDWREEPCVDVATFRSYLHSVMRSSETGRIDPFTLSSHDKHVQLSIMSSHGKRHDNNNPWRATISVLMLSPSEFCGIYKHKDISCFIERPQSAPSGLLPRLRVRAHYIDSVDIAHLDVTWCRWTREILGTRNITLSRWFKREALPKDGPPPKEGSDIHREDLHYFRTMNYSYPTWMMFSSHYSVGYRPHNVQLNEADEIFAVDGAKELLILRRAKGEQYRVVSTCYLWAAWELDCWNPGSKKGRWGPDVERPTAEQTRMIEIY